MLESDPERPLQNSLHRRFEQLKRWEQSDFCHEASKFKEADKVGFPLGTQLLAACSCGDIEEAGRLLRKGVDVNTSNVDGLTALHQACIDNDLDLVQFLIQHGCDVDVKDNEGWTPLHATASCAYTEVAKYLLSQGADLAAVNNDGDLSVDLADNQEMEALLHDEMCRRGIDADKARSVEEQKMLKDTQRWQKTGRYVEILDPKSGASPLHVAAAKGYHEVILLLLQCPGVNVNARDFDGWTPLHAAAHWGQERACEILVDNNADLDLHTNAAQTIYEIAEPELVDLLKELKNKQLSRRQAVSPEIADSLPRKEGGGKRRSSVTRMSVDQKASVTSKIAEQEGLPNVQPEGNLLSGGAGDSTGFKMPSPVDEEAPDVRSWTKRTPQTEGAESQVTASAGTNEKPEITSVQEPPKKETKEKSPSPAASVPTQPEVPPVVEEKKVSEVPEAKERKPSQDEPKPKEEVSAAPSLPQESNKANGIEPNESPMVGPRPGQLNQRRTDQDSQSSDKRVSAVMAPMKGEESETQRSARARHARATRRSTQGVSQDELQEAKKLLNTTTTTGTTQTITTTTVVASPLDSGTDTTTTAVASPARSSVTSLQSIKPTRTADAANERNGTSLDQRPADRKESQNDSVGDSGPASGLPTTRPRRHQRRQVPAAPNEAGSNEPSKSQSSTTNISSPSRLSSSSDRRTFDEFKTPSATATTTTTTTKSSSIPSATVSTSLSHQASRPTRPLSTLASSTSLTTSDRSSPPTSSTWRPRSTISVDGNNYGSSLTRTPTFHGTSSTSSVDRSDRQLDVTPDTSSRLPSTTGTSGDDTDWRMRRRARRGERPPSGKPQSGETTQSTASEKSTSGPTTTGPKTDSGRYSLHGDSTDSVRQSSHRPNSYHDSSSPRTFTSRYGSNTSVTDSGPMDYKKLYEQERLESERLRKELEQTKKELTDSRNDAERLKKQQSSSSVDTRRLERKLSEYEEEIKLAEKIRTENEKLKAENRALARVVARLSREQ